MPDQFVSSANSLRPGCCAEGCRFVSRDEGLAVQVSTWFGSKKILKHHTSPGWEFVGGIYNRGVKMKSLE